MTDIALQDQCQPDALLLLVRGVPGASTTDFCVAPARLLSSYLISTIFQLKKFSLQRGVVLSGASCLRPAQLISGGVSVRLGAPYGESFPFSDTADILHLVKSSCWERGSEFGAEVGVVLVSGTPFELPTDKVKAKRMQETWISARSRQLKMLAENIAALPSASPALQQAPSQKATLISLASNSVPPLVPSVTTLPPREAPKPPKVDLSSLPAVNSGDDPAKDTPTAPETYRCPSCLNDISVHSRTIHSLRCRGVQAAAIPTSAAPVLQCIPVPANKSRSSSSAPSTGSSEFDDTHADDDYECHYEDVPSKVTSPPPATLPPTRLPTVTNTIGAAPSPPRHQVQSHVNSQPRQHVQRSSPPRSEVSRQSSLPSVHRQPQPMSLHDDVDVDYCRDDAALAARLHREAEEELEEESRRLAFQLAESSHVSGSRGAPSRPPPPQQTKYPPHVNPYQRKAPTASQQPSLRYGQAPQVRTPVSSTTRQNSGNSHHAFLDRASRPQPASNQPIYASGRPLQQLDRVTPTRSSSGRPLPQRTTPTYQASGRPQYHQPSSTTNRHDTLSADERYARELQEREDEETARAISNSTGGRGASHAQRLAAEERRLQEEADEAYALQLMEEDNY